MTDPKASTTPCAGLNCGITRTDQEHSLECIAEHAAAVAGGRFVPLGAETEALAAECKKLRLEACKLSVRASFSINSEVLDALTAAESAADAAIDRLAALAQPVAPAEGMAANWQADPMDIIRTIALGLERGYTPAELLDENSPVRDRIRLALATPTAAKAAPPDEQLRTLLHAACAAEGGGPTANLLAYGRAVWAAATAAPLPEQAEDAPTPQPPLRGRWHHGNGILGSGTLRIARADFDTNPTQELQHEVFQWITDTLNAAQARARATIEASDYARWRDSGARKDQP